VIKPGLTLGEKDRRFLWDAEHHGLLLAEYGFKPLAAALGKRDARAIGTMMTPAFEGRAPRQARRVAVDADFAEVSRLEGDGRSYEKLDRDGFARWLVGRLSIFGPDPAAKISVTSLRPADRDRLDGLWIGGIRMRVWGSTARGSPAELQYYARIGIDRPTREHLAGGSWLRWCAIDKVKTARAPAYLMREVAREWGLDTASLHDNWNHGPERSFLITGGVYLSDFNRDGVVDMLINDFTLDHGYALYRGQTGGGLIDVTRQVGLPRGRPVMLLAWADLDGDGWEDLILGPGLIFRNVKGQRFDNVTQRSNLPNVAGVARLQGQSGIALADYDSDGRIDLYVFRSTTKPREGSWVEGKIGDDYENRLLRNLGDWQFEDVTARSGTDGGKRSTFSAVWLDANSDGRPDIYVIHEFGNGLLLVNRGDGTFEERQIVEGPADFGSMGVTCGDLDNDGGIDVYVASMYSTAGNRIIGNLPPGVYPDELMLQLRQMVAGSQVYRNTGELRFDRVADEYDVAAVGWAYGPSLLDLDNDGWLDLYVPTGFISRNRARPDG
jgi:hypothetical protein